MAVVVLVTLHTLQRKTQCYKVQKPVPTMTNLASPSASRAARGGISRNRSVTTQHTRSRCQTSPGAFPFKWQKSNPCLFFRLVSFILALLEWLGVVAAVAVLLFFLLLFLRIKSHSLSVCSVILTVQG